MYAALAVDENDSERQAAESSGPVDLVRSRSRSSGSEGPTVLSKISDAASEARAKFSAKFRELADRASSISHSSSSSSQGPASPDRSRQQRSGSSGIGFPGIGRQSSAPAQRQQAQPVRML